jgi:integrase
MSLTETQIQKFKSKDKVYRKLDKDGLYLEVATSGTKSWIHRYSFNNKSTMRVIGHYDNKSMSLRSAREELLDDKKLLDRGVNPKDVKGKNKNKSTSVGVTFKDVFFEWHNLQSNSWSPAYAQDVIERASNYLLPFIGSKLVCDITPQEMITLLKRMDDKGVLDTLSKVRSIASRVFRYSVGIGVSDVDPVRDIPNDIFTPKKKSHYSTMTKPKDISRLLKMIDCHQGTHQVETALKLAPYLFLRPGELTGLTWDEIDFDNSLIRIDAQRMKMKVEHLVPMSQQVVSIIRELQTIKTNSKFLFPSPKSNSQPITTTALRAALRGLGISKEEFTPHGFRHMASTQLNELGYKSDIIERQLSHAEKNKVRAAYNYAEYLSERVKMMSEWANYLDKLKSQ